ncbi:hypothetical protein B7494_g4832 [Chlorociboria aeruginascens]|nr:hypothetical protein B7494_g4832 [Chlorociboria aeruginascens]
MTTNFSTPKIQTLPLTQHYPGEFLQLLRAAAPTAIMLDSNLPTFSIRPPTDNPLTSVISLSQNDNDPTPEYLLRRPSPHLPASKNCYGIGLFDCINIDVLYAEVQVEPEWTQPTLSQAEIRAQGPVSQPLVPIVPNHFVIQLYNPDQQVIVRQIAGSWNSSAHWEFELPQTSFRQPSASALDRSQSDPAVSEVTPKVAFKWKRDGKLSRDITCFLAGRSTEGKKHKSEPDIPIAMFKNSNSSKNLSLTLYEPNMKRIDIEDLKGLEVVLLLSSMVIKDIFFDPSRELFNISSPTITRTKRKNSGPVISGRTSTSPPLMSGAFSAVPPLRQTTQGNALDEETARLKAQVEAEDRARRMSKEQAQREEERRTQEMLEAEEQERRQRRDAEVERETERLKREYGVTGIDTGPELPPRNSHSTRPYSYSQPWSQQMPQYQSAPHSQPVPVQRPVSTPSVPPAPGIFHSQTLENIWSGPQISSPPTRPNRQSGVYLQTPGAGTASSSGFFGLGGKKVTKKRSVFF